MSLSRIERRKRKKFFAKLMQPYRMIAAKTPDRHAATAIHGLIGMLEHAAAVMEEYGMGGPVDPADDAWLGAAIEALDDDEQLEKLGVRPPGFKQDPALEGLVMDLVPIFTETFQQPATVLGPMAGDDAETPFITFAMLVCEEQKIPVTAPLISAIGRFHGLAIEEDEDNILPHGRGK